MRKRYKLNIRLPQQIIFRLYKLVPRNKLGSVTTAFKTKRPTTFRVNGLKIKGHELRNEMMGLGFKLDTVPWYKDAFVLQSKSLKELKLLKYYTEGYLYVQSLSSMLPVLILEPCEKEKILDICAAPGGKTTQIAAMSSNKAEILSCDSSPIRIEVLKHNVNRQNAQNTYVLHTRAEDLEKKFDCFFDKVLVDTPCSGEGRISLFDKTTYKDWSVKKIRSFADLQKKILFSGYKALRPGGILVYSTCTMAPEENEDIVDWLLEKEKGKVQTMPIQIPYFQFSEPIMSWEGREFNIGVKNTVRVLPSFLMEGFFIAKLKKLKN